MLALRDSDCADVRQRAEQKRRQIDAQRKDLKALRRTLSKLIDACGSGKDATPCPIVETLTGRSCSGVGR
jgi:hypothetical protein